MKDLLNAIGQFYQDHMEQPKTPNTDPQNEDELNKQVGAGLAQPTSSATDNLKNALGG